MLFGVSGSTHAGVGADDHASLEGGSLGMIGKLQECIQRAISQLNYESAIFLSEILYAECCSLEKGHMHRLDAAYLYGLSLYMNEEYHTAFDIVKEFKSSSHAGVCYIFARCCLKLSKNLNDAVSSLVSIVNIRPSVTSTINANNNLICIPNSATLNSVLGKLYEKLDKVQESSLHHSEALNMDPYLWESCTALCHMKVKIDLRRLYSVMSRKSQNLSSSSNRYKTRFGVSKPQSSAPPCKAFVNNSTTSIGSSTISQQPHHQHYPLGPPQTLTKGQPSGSLLNKANVIVTTNPLSPSASQGLTAGSGSFNKSIRNKLVVTPPSKLLNTGNFRTPRNHNITNSGLSTKNPDQSKGLTVEQSNQKSDLTAIPQVSSDTPVTLEKMLFHFARILSATSQFDSYRAIRLVESHIPSHIKERMPWCQAQLGKLHFEIVNYDMSMIHFNKLRQLQPTRVKDMEVFSTLLWHLHDKVNLSHLSNELLTLLPNKPEPWCCLGNLYSLQRDHEEAIKYFEKATEFDSTFAYAYTLQGHEHSSNDSIDTAKNCYRKAIACDPQHYNAYYGLGMCCMKLGQYQEALLFFEKARNINPVNVILICCCGVALEKLSYQEKALQYYELACELQPSSSLAKFKKAHLLYAMARYSVALENFEELEKLAPDEATVHFLLGQLYQIMGRKKDAYKQFTIAMTLDPKGNTLIIEALTKCHSEE